MSIKYIGDGQFVVMDRLQVKAAVRVGDEWSVRTGYLATGAVFQRSDGRIWSKTRMVPCAFYRVGDEQLSIETGQELAEIAGNKGGYYQYVPIRSAL